MLVGEGHPVDLGVDQVRHQIGARLAAALLQQVDEVGLDAGGGRLGHRGEPGVVGLAVLELVHPTLQPGPVGAGLGQPEQVEEHLVGHRPGELLGEVDGAAVPPRVDQPAHRGPDDSLALGDAARQQRWLHDRADLVVAGVVDIGQEAGWVLVLGGVVDVDALERQVGRGVERGRPHVVEPRQRPPVPLLAVEHRGLITHPPVHGERIGLERRAERVVLQARGRDVRHVTTLRWIVPTA